jgi:hypothetical protein
LRFKAFVINSSLTENDIELSKIALSTYKFPIISVVFDSNGKVLNTLYPNEDFNHISSPIVAKYLKFLNTAIRQKNV